MPHKMKSVMIFDPKDSDEETANKFIGWLRHNKSSIGDKHVPNVAETQKYLRELTGS